MNDSISPSVVDSNWSYFMKNVTRSYERTVGQLHLLEMIIFMIRHRIENIRDIRSLSNLLLVLQRIKCTYTVVAETNDLKINVHNIPEPGNSGGNVYKLTSLESGSEMNNHFELYLVRRDHQQLQKEHHQQLQKEHQKHQEKEDKITKSMFIGYDMSGRPKPRGYPKHDSYEGYHEFQKFSNGMYTYEEYDHQQSSGNKLLLQLLFHPLSPIKPISCYWRDDPEYWDDQMFEKRYEQIRRHCSKYLGDSVSSIVVEYLLSSMYEQISELYHEVRYLKCIDNIKCCQNDEQTCSVLYNRQKGLVYHVEIQGRRKKETVLLEKKNFQNLEMVKTFVADLRTNYFEVHNPVTDDVVVDMIVQSSWE